MIDQAEIHRKANSSRAVDRLEAATSLGSAFPHVPNKSEAWQDLYYLIGDNDLDVRWLAVISLGSAFPHVPNKSEAWQGLYCMTHDRDFYVQMDAARSLGLAFPHVPNKADA